MVVVVNSGSGGCGGGGSVLGGYHLASTGMAALAAGGCSAGASASAFAWCGQAPAQCEVTWGAVLVGGAMVVVVS